MIVYGEAGLKKDHPVVAFLAQVGAAPARVPRVGGAKAEGAPLYCCGGYTPMGQCVSLSGSTAISSTQGMCSHLPTLSWVQDNHAKSLGIYKEG